MGRSKRVVTMAERRAPWDHCLAAGLIAFGAFVVDTSCNGSSSASSDAGSGTPAACSGGERCACYGNGTCDQGLACLSGLCVRLNNSGSNMALDAAVGALGGYWGRALPFR